MNSRKQREYRLVSIRILEILNKYTDKEHPMFQAELMDRLKKEYAIKITRHTCSDYLSELRQAGYVKGARGIYTSYRFSDEYITELYADLVSGKIFSKEEATKLVEHLMFPKTMELNKVLFIEENKEKAGTAE